MSGHGWDYLKQVRGIGLAGGDPGCGCRSGASLGVVPMTPEQARAAAAAALPEVYNNLSSKGAAILERYGPGIDVVAAGVRAMDSGTPQDIVWNTMDVTLAAVALVPPVGTIIAAIGKIITGIAQWLVSAYPAYAVYCTGGMALRSIFRAYLGLSSSPENNDLATRTLIRDQRRFWIGSTHVRASSYQDWGYAHNNQNICKPYLPGVPDDQGVRFCTWMDRGTVEERMARLEIACRPIRKYKTGVPAPLGYRSWRQWENETGHAERQEKRDADMAAAVVAGQQIRDGLIANGDPKYVGTWGDLCAWYGFLIKLSGIPNESLIEILSRVAQSAPDSMPDNVDPNTYIRPAPDQPGVIYWEDGLVDAYMRFWDWIDVGDKTYAIKALIDEYNDRTASGRIRRRATMTFRPAPGMVERAPSSGLGPVPIVASLGVAGLLLWLALS